MSAEAAPRRWTVTVYGRLPVLNELLRMHAMEQYRRLARWREWTYLSLRAAGVPTLGRVRVTCTRYAPGTRPPDPDGLAGGFKPVLDGLEMADVVPNDDAAHLRAEYRAERCRPGLARVELVIEEWL